MGGVVYSQLVGAASISSGWMNTFDIRDRTKIRTVSQQANITHPKECVRKTEKVSISSGRYKYIEDDCWRIQTGGTYNVSENNNQQYVRLSGAPSAFPLLNDGSVFFFAGDRMVQMTNKDASGAYEVYIYDEPHKAITMVKNGEEMQGKFDRTKARQVVDYFSRAPARVVGEKSINHDGKWVVMQTHNSFARLSLDTATLLSFISMYDASSNLRAYYERDEEGNSTYDYLRSAYQTTATSDGRFIAIAASDDIRSVVTIYDVGECDYEYLTRCSPGISPITYKVFNGQEPSKIFQSSFDVTGKFFDYIVNEDGTLSLYSIGIENLQFGMDYLALGDSFSSGEGDGNGMVYYLPGTDGDGANVEGYKTDIVNYPYSAEKCHISSRSYPFLLAEQAELSRVFGFRSVACSGATISDVINTIADDASTKGRYNGHYRQLGFIDNPDVVKDIKSQAINNYTPARAAQLEFVTSYKPKVVTIGVGGNDLGFSEKLTACVTSKFTTCEVASNTREQTAIEIETTVYNRLLTTYRDLKHASPLTQFYAIGYPQIFSANGSCDLNAQVDQTEREYAIFTVQYLNMIIKAAATQSGIPYIDIEHSLAATNLCSGKDFPTVNGLTTGNDIYGVIGSESYHPNEEGHKLIADYILHEELQGMSITEFQPCSQDQLCTYIGLPPRPAYFGGSRQFSGITPTLEQFIEGTGYLKKIFLDAEKTFRVYLTNKLFKPNSTVLVELHSSPVQLGSLPVSSDGMVTGEVTLPSSVMPGLHTVHIYAEQISGEVIDYYQPLFIATSEKDMDGNDIEDDRQPCLFVPASGKDEDRDGIDDACDRVIWPRRADPDLGQGSDAVTAAPATIGAFDPLDDASVGSKNARTMLRELFDIDPIWVAPEPISPANSIPSRKEPSSDSAKHGSSNAQKSVERAPGKLMDLVFIITVIVYVIVVVCLIRYVFHKRFTVS